MDLLFARSIKILQKEAVEATKAKRRKEEKTKARGT
jgi:hypothetical protein